MGRMVYLTFISALLVHRCTAFVNPGVVPSLPLRRLQLVYPQHVDSPRPSLSSLSMAKKSAGAGSKRKKKKRAPSDTDREVGTVEGASVTDADSSVYSASSVAEGPEDAGSVIMDGGFGSKRTPAQGGLLADDVVGTDAAREAKVEETLRKLGVKGVTEMKAQAGKGKTVGPDIKSVLDVVPEDTQVLIERFFIAGFVLCLLVLVGCGISIATEAYFLSTDGKLPPDLDNFVVQTVQPLFTPILVATFAFSSSWGVLKLGQMGQEGVVYREDD